ncbi:MAG: hypothetical protein ABW032_11075 [Burkholderiaceae bacterium]
MFEGSDMHSPASTEANPAMSSSSASVSVSDDSGSVSPIAPAAKGAKPIGGPYAAESPLESYAGKSRKRSIGDAGRENDRGAADFAMTAVAEDSREARFPHRAFKNLPTRGQDRNPPTLPGLELPPTAAFPMFPSPFGDEKIDAEDDADTQPAVVGATPARSDERLASIPAMGGGNVSMEDTPAQQPKRRRQGSAGRAGSPAAEDESFSPQSCIDQAKYFVSAHATAIDQRIRAGASLKQAVSEQAQMTNDEALEVVLDKLRLTVEGPGPASGGGAGQVPPEYDVEALLGDELKQVMARSNSPWNPVQEKDVPNRS